MNSLEKFGLVSGIIGLVSDIVGLVSFLAGLWRPSALNSGTGELPFVLQVISAFMIIYGWFSISWVLIRKAFLSRKHSKKQFIDASAKTVFAVGIMIFPLVLAWWVAIVRTEEAQQRVEIAERKSAAATQAALITPSTNIVQITPTVSPFAGNPDRVDGSGWYCATIPAHVAMMFGMFLVVVLIMPNIHSDMPEVTIDDLFPSS